MFINKKKSSADKAFELCVDLLAEIKKQGRAIEAFAVALKGVEGKLTGMEEFITEFEAAHGRALRDINGAVGEVKALVSELKDGVMAYEQKKEDAVTAAQILDEYLNGENGDE